VDAYGRGDYAGTRTALGATVDRAKVIRDFRAGGNPWPGDPRREAVFALELAEAGLVAHRDDARLAARDLLVSHAKLVRQPFTPDEFERNWLWAEIAMLEGVLQPAATEGVVANALKRFPDEPRFLLARAVAADQRASFSATGAAPRSQALPAIDVAEAYDAAIAHPSTAAEARIRKAWYLHRLGQNTSALPLIDAALARSPDTSLRYLRELFRGHVLMSLGQSESAIAAYRAARTISPDAQSASVALMNALYTRGDRREAEALSEAVQAAQGNANDPWWSYWQGDYRFYPAAIGRLRGFLQ
jgi:tetratricopeptide (TPR) repeat protein